jgi:hypothetical protein
MVAVVNRRARRTPRYVILVVVSASTYAPIDPAYLVVVGGVVFLEVDAKLAMVWKTVEITVAITVSITV